MKTYFKWHDIKKNRIYDPMEKISIKKELYILNYEFLKFYLIFPIFYLIFNWIFKFFLFKIAKKG